MEKNFYFQSIQSKEWSRFRIFSHPITQDSCLGISFGEDDVEVEVIEWNFKKIDKRRTRTSKEEVLKQVLFGLESVNKSLGMNYKLSKIYFSPFDIPVNHVYSGLISVLIKHYHSGNEFKEV